MTSKQKVERASPTTPCDGAALKHLSRGSRVRCANGTLGRVAWASSTTVKIVWENGERDIWRLDTLAGRCIEILDPSIDAPFTSRAAEHWGDGDNAPSPIRERRRA
ncbi:MAG TPA: hypothetical protein VGF59_37050 [Bryobacteraceae bacterium]